MTRILFFAVLGGLFHASCFADDGVFHQVLLDGSRASHLGLTDAANAGTIDKKKLDLIVISSPGEMLEAIPGVIVSQHSGEGKANQSFLRGFNLDHGTDLRTSLDDMPINQRSHAHGQGWTDLNFIIPELTARLDYKKGPYSASTGDFSSAGSASMTYAQSLSRSIISTSIGQNGYQRALLAGSPELGDGIFLYAFELTKKDGPFVHPDDYKKKNAVIRYSQGYANNGFSISGMTYAATWNSSDQIPLRAVESGSLNRFDTIDPTDGGSTKRNSLSSLWRRTTSEEASKVSAYLIQQKLDLFSNFTYFLQDPVLGDQFSQPDNRVTSGINASHTWHLHSNKNSNDFTIGLQLQNDSIFNALNKTYTRQYISTIRQDHIRETSLGLYGYANTRWNDYFRSNVGLRHDRYQSRVHSDTPNNSGIANGSLLSPSVSLIFGPLAKTEFYLNAGNGFHSNDARATLTTIDPNSLQQVERSPTLVRSRGGDIGIRSEIIANLRSTFSIFRLDFDSELNYVGDAGTTIAGQPSRRKGIESSNSYQIYNWLAIDLDVAMTKSRSYGVKSNEGNYLTGAVERVAQFSVSMDKLGPWSGALRVRYFGSRPLNETNTVRSSASTTVNAQISYKITPGLKLELEGFNLGNNQAAPVSYFYESQLKSENRPQQDIHFHPAEPRAFRLVLVKTY